MSEDSVPEKLFLLPDVLRQLWVHHDAQDGKFLQNFFNSELFHCSLVELFLWVVSLLQVSSVEVVWLAWIPDGVMSHDIYKMSAQ